MYDDNPLCDWKCPVCDHVNASEALENSWMCERDTCYREFDSDHFYRDDEQTDPEYNWYLYRGSQPTTPELSEDEGDGEGENGDE
jgi:hypothetical protein